MQQLRIAYVPGVTPGKWFDRFTERHPEAQLDSHRHDSGDILNLLASDQADAVFVRFATGANPKDPSRHVIPLYEELEVVCAAKDHDVEYYDDEIPVENAAEFPALDLADYPEEAGGVETAMEVVASGALVARMPMSLARLHHRRDVIYRVVAGAPTTSIGIAWRSDVPDAELIEEFIGIVRGRSANSSRQRSVRENEQRSRKTARTAKKTGAKPAAKPGGKAGTKPGRKPPRRR